MALGRVPRPLGGLTLGGAGIGIGLLAGLPLSATVGVAVAACAAGAAISLLGRRHPRAERIDPFTLSEAWRGPVKGAMQASARYAQVLGSMPPGPLRERLVDIGHSIDRSVEECWRVAKRGHAVTTALSALDADQARLALGAGNDASSAPADGVLLSAEAQAASAERLRAVADQAQRRLRLLEARLHEAVATAVELSVSAGEAPEAGGLADEIDDVADQLSALRSALDEAGAAGQ